MNELQVFAFNDHLVRAVQKDGEPWWVAKDVCDVLGLGNITETLRNLDEDELTSVILKSGGQDREMRLVSEAGLYNLIFRSRKDEARAFRRWVTHEVLPTIRKTGGYSSSRKIRELIERYEHNISKEALGKLVILEALELTGRKRISLGTSGGDMSNEVLGRKEMERPALTKFVNELYPPILRPLNVDNSILWSDYLQWCKDNDSTPLNRWFFFQCLTSLSLGKRYCIHRKGPAKRGYTFEKAAASA